ncbi:MAG TPA: Tim44-like domain-containing protein [Telluria sp.]
MKKLLVTMMLAITTMSMVVEATARPMGGKRSFGRQSPAAMQRANTPTPAPAPTAAQRPAAAGAAAAAPAAAAAKGGMWKGMLGGALLGLGLGALLSSMGLGGAAASMIASILMIALLAMAGLFIWRMFKRKDTPANSAFEGFNKPVAAGAGGATPEIGSALPRAGYQPAAQPAAFQPSQQMPGSAGDSQPHVTTPYGVPSDFDSATFLRHAKSSFIRMQAAWDKADFNDLREFTTPEVYAELKMQIQERGDVADFTDVVSIDAELLGIETTPADYLASVKFVGKIKTDPTALAEPFTEVWNMSKPIDGSTGWVLAGIQQLS